MLSYSKCSKIFDDYLVLHCTFQAEYGDDATRAEVSTFEPQRVVRSRRLEDEMGGGGWEEYVEYIFPDTSAEQPNRKLLAMAAKWASQLDSAASENEDDLDEDDDDVLDEDDLKHETVVRNSEEIDLSDVLNSVCAFLRCVQLDTFFLSNHQEIN